MIHQMENWAHSRSKIVKSGKSYSNGHLPNHLFNDLITWRARTCMTWRVNLCAQKDAQKQLARTSLSIDLKDNNGEPSVIEWQILPICKNGVVPTSGSCCS